MAVYRKINELCAKLSKVCRMEFPVSRILLRSMVYSVDTQEKCIALTFDDGPTPDTEALLQVLDANGAKATFFVVGSKAEKRRELLADMHRRGFEIANHTWDHLRFNTLGTGEILTQVNKTNHLIAEITGEFPRFMRAPGKITTDFQNSLIYLCSGVKVVNDTFSPPDFRADCPVSIIVEALLKLSRPGSIVCLHDMHPHTREALAEALPILRDRGFSFKTISAMAETGALSPYRRDYVPVQFREYAAH